MASEELVLESERRRIERSTDLSEHELAHIADALRGLRFGQVTIIIHEGAIVQIDRSERRRFPARD